MPELKKVPEIIGVPLVLPPGNPRTLDVTPLELGVKTEWVEMEGSP